MDSKSFFGGNRLVHLDLKRCPLKVDYLEKLFPLLKGWGATGVLIEWEDTFPYTGNLAEVGSANSLTRAYSDDDVYRIYQLADALSLAVIPLVQTFGHLENGEYSTHAEVCGMVAMETILHRLVSMTTIVHGIVSNIVQKNGTFCLTSNKFVLRHEKWAYLREVGNFPSSMCPSHPEAIQLVTSMIDQVISKAPKPPIYFHIGADEVWHMGLCAACCDQDKHILLLNHLILVLRYFKDKYPGIRPIMWDDMLRGIPGHLIKEYALGDLVDIMVWFYESGNNFYISEELWGKYGEVFGKLWVASAYKGSTGPCQVLPVLQHHISNHEQWLSLILKQNCCLIIGIALTGWSRYDHFATLCELMPTAIPSLALCLRICSTGGYDQILFKRVCSSLGYKDDVQPSMNPFPRPQAVAGELDFPGWKAATGVEWYANLKGKHQSLLYEKVGAWLNPWQLKNNFTNPMQIQGLVNGLFELTEEWKALEAYMTKHLGEAYYDATIDEWLATLVQPLKSEAKLLYKSGQQQLNINKSS